MQKHSHTTPKRLAALLTTLLFGALLLATPVLAGEEPAGGRLPAGGINGGTAETGEEQPTDAQTEETPPGDETPPPDAQTQGGEEGAPVHAPTTRTGAQGAAPDAVEPETIDLKELYDGAQNKSTENWEYHHSRGDLIITGGGAYTLTTGGATLGIEVTIDTQAETAILLQNLILSGTTPSGNDSLLYIQAGSTTLRAEGTNGVDVVARAGASVTLDGSLGDAIGTLGIYNTATATVTGGQLTLEQLRLFAGGTLRVDAAVPRPAVTANGALSTTLYGHVELFNYPLPARAGALESLSLVNAFASDSIAPQSFTWAEAGRYDYITMGYAWSSGKFFVYPALVWNATDGSANGVFTIPDGERFELDVVLAQNTSTITTGWDGETLTKEGGGTLVLSQTDSIPGAVRLQEGEIYLENIDQTFGAGSTVAAGTKITGAAGQAAADVLVLHCDDIQGEITLSSGGLLLDAAPTQISGRVDLNDGHLYGSGNDVQIADGGLLRVGGNNALIALDTTVQSGGRLQMPGSGNEVLGSLTLADGAVYQVESPSTQTAGMAVVQALAISAGATIVVPGDIQAGSYELFAWNEATPGHDISLPQLAFDGEPPRGVDTALSIEGGKLVLDVTQHAAHTITFDTLGGTAVTPATWYANENPAAPAAPTRTGYTFAGWFADAACKTPYSFGTPLTGDITLYAGWQAVTTSPEDPDPGKPGPGDPAPGASSPAPGSSGDASPGTPGTASSRPGGASGAAPSGSTGSGAASGGASASSSASTGGGTSLGVTGLPTTIRVGDIFTLYPEESETQSGSDGWTWDAEYFSATFNSPATFTALKAGSTQITFTSASGRSVTLDVSILEQSATASAKNNSGAGGSAVANTGDGTTVWPWVALAAVAVALIGGLLWVKRRGAGKR